MLCIYLFFWLLLCLCSPVTKWVNFILCVDGQLWEHTWLCVVMWLQDIWLWERPTDHKKTKKLCSTAVSVLAPSVLFFPSVLCSCFISHSSFSSHFPKRKNVSCSRIHVPIIANVFMFHEVTELCMFLYFLSPPFVSSYRQLQYICFPLQCYEEQKAFFVS